MRITSLSYDPKFFICENEIIESMKGLIGRHLNMLNEDHTIRIDRAKFIDLLNRVLEYCNLSQDL